ncbi:uncharacterized protein T551_03570 [Pneumocystis jirovecii RU7]|uniref:Uncharacterized protein n=1 Tax=Pneumocystis jirovecii (strain RU7) TaxID=1408657 RepID=A0A0W4ZD20_PNEJ7|nr:uncharacterized protein T551_03570 [Pneumocystis jirovecii RU7]KTW26271.1 hypothetical protein T551_03570 [Pneumocystis jirovecii RU7]
MEAKVRQQKLEAAKKRMNEVKKKIRADQPHEWPAQVQVDTTNESKSTVPSILTENIQEDTQEIDSTCKKFLNEEESINIAKIQTQEDIALNEYIDENKGKISEISPSLSNDKSSIGISKEQNKNLQIEIESRQESEEKGSNISNEQWDVRKSIEIMENTIKELKSQISFLQRSYLEINEKLNTILLKVDTDNTVLQREKTEIKEHERISQLEAVIKSLEEKLKNVQYSAQEDSVLPKMEHPVQSQGYDYLSFEDISLNTVNTSPESKQGSQFYYKTCKIDLRKTGGCIGCSGDILEI